MLSFLHNSLIFTLAEETKIKVESNSGNLIDPVNFAIEQAGRCGRGKPTLIINYRSFNCGCQVPLDPWVGYCTKPVGAPHGWIEHAHCNLGVVCSSQVSLEATRFPRNSPRIHSYWTRICSVVFNKILQKIIILCSASKATLEMQMKSLHSSRHQRWWGEGLHPSEVFLELFLRPKWPPFLWNSLSNMFHTLKETGTIREETIYQFGNHFFWRWVEHPLHPRFLSNLIFLQICFLLSNSRESKMCVHTHKQSPFQSPNRAGVYTLCAHKLPWLCLPPTHTHYRGSQAKMNTACEISQTKYKTKYSIEKFHCLLLCEKIVGYKYNNQYKITISTTKTKTARPLPLPLPLNLPYGRAIEERSFSTQTNSLWQIQNNQSRSHVLCTLRWNLRSDKKLTPVSKICDRSGLIIWRSPLGIILTLMPANQNFDARVKKSDAAQPMWKPLMITERTLQKVRPANLSVPKSRVS